MVTNRIALHGTAYLAAFLALSLGTVSQAKSPSVNQAAPLAEAIQAERDGDEVLRQAALAKALRDSPADSATRWYNGYVRIGAKWVAADDVLDSPASSVFLEEYKRLRQKSKPTVESQLHLADFCRRHGLKAQERVHLSAVVELEPNRAAARARLGHEQIDGVWRTPEEIATARRVAKETATALKVHGSELKRLKEQLKRHTLSRDEAAEHLRDMRSAAVIPAWELHLSSSSSVGALAVVDALRAMPEPEASLSLTRHALFSALPEVQNAALEALKPRDEHSYVPPVLAELHSPWQSKVQLLSQPGQPLVYRFSTYSEGAEKRQLAVFDDVFFLGGDTTVAGILAQDAARRNSQFRDNLRKQENASIKSSNDQISRFLRETTDEQEAESPDEWWQWWNDRNGVYVEGEKPLEQSYAVGYTTITAPMLSGGSLRRKECLAAGTPVWTDHGPVDVDRVRLGDIVLSQDPVTGELAFKPVLRTTVRAPELLFRIEAGGEPIRASGGHPFWVSGKGWVLARDLQPGMVLHGVNQPSRIEEITEEEEPAASFNLVVEGFHTYFAGSGKVLSHDNSVRRAGSSGRAGVLE